MSARAPTYIFLDIRHYVIILCVNYDMITINIICPS